MSSKAVITFYDDLGLIVTVVLACCVAYRNPHLVNTFIYWPWFPFSFIYPVFFCGITTTHYSPKLENWGNPDSLQSLLDTFPNVSLLRCYHLLPWLRLSSFLSWTNSTAASWGILSKGFSAQAHSPHNRASSI